MKEKNTGDLPRNSGNQGARVCLLKTSHAQNFFTATAALLLGSLATPARADLMYVTIGTNSTIEKITSAAVGSVFANSTNGLNNPSGLAFDTAGNFYVSNSVGSTILKLTPGGASTVFASTGLSTPRGLAFDRAGSLYVANSSNDTIEKFTATGGLLSNSGTVFANTGIGSSGFTMGRG